MTPVSAGDIDPNMGGFSAYGAAATLPVSVNSGVETWSSDKPFAPKCKQDLIEALDESGHIVLCDDQAPNGMFDCLEDALTELGISWERWSDSYCEYDAEIVWWHPGMDGQDGIICNADGNEVVLAEPVKEAYALLRHCFSDRPGSGNPEMRDDAMKKLASVVTNVPTLPPLEFVD